MNEMRGNGTPYSILKRLLIRLLLVIFGLCISFLLLELAARGAYWLREYNSIRRAQLAGEIWPVYDPILGYRLNPEFGDTNSHGLRDHPILPKQNRFRLLMLGDSVGYYGDTIEDTYVRRMASILNADPTIDRLDVINTSVRGYTTYQELLYLKHYGIAFDPDLVGVGFVLNDLHKFLHGFRVRDGKIVQHSMYAFTEEATGTVSPQPKSLFLRWLGNRLSLSLATLRVQNSSEFSFDHRIDFNTAWKNEPWERIEGYLGEMLSLGREHQFEVFVAVFPMAAQYEPNYLQKNRTYVLKPQEKLRSICARLGIPYFDLYPHLNRDKHLEDDGIHLTLAGRKEVANQLAEFLKGNELVPLNPALSNKRSNKEKDGAISLRSDVKGAH